MRYKLCSSIPDRDQWVNGETWLRKSMQRLKHLFTSLVD